MENDILIHVVYKNEIPRFNCFDAIASLRCFQCNFETNKFVDLKEHLRAGHALLKSDDTFYECKSCTFQTYSKYLLLQHKLRNFCITEGKIKSENVVLEGDTKLKLTEETEPDPFRCNCELLRSSLLVNNINSKYLRSVEMKCENCSFQNKTDLEQNSGSSAPSQETDEWSKCPYCHFESDYKQPMLDHIGSYHYSEEKKLRKCVYCPYSSKRSTDLRIHVLAKHTDPDKIEWFECVHCSYKGKRQAHLKRHISYKHGNVAKFKCNQCKFESKFKRSLQDHIITKHTDPSKIPWFECEHCSHKFRNKYNLKKHVDYEHDNKIKFKCDHCQFETKKKHSLQVHTLKHTPPDKIHWFKCEHCTYKTKKNSLLNKHMDYIHGNKTKCKCDHCNFESRFKQTLRNHILVNHTDPEKIQWFECDHCSYKSKIKFYLKTHVDYQHGNKSKLKCHHCEFETKRKQSLQNHLLHIHKLSGKQTKNVN